MAETLTMESNVETTTLENLSAEEQNSLEVGEQMQQAQDNLLAGKYKNAQELEKGYLELQQKLGEDEQPQEEYEEGEYEEGEYEEGEYEDTILDQLWDEATSETGEYSEESLEELRGMSVEEIAQMHLDYRNSVEQEPQAREFTEQDIQQLKGIVGGEANYANMIDWAQKSCTEQEIKMFDQVMANGDPLGAFFAVRALAYAYNDAVGYDGNMVQGKAPRQGGDQFRSQQELIAAMSDTRYENDPAYRQDVMDKLQRSPNVNF